MRRTKIVATLGPATDKPEVLRGIIAAGLDVARFNFSHGDYEGHKKRLDDMRKACEETGATIALLADTKGPEIRLGTFQGDRTELVTGSAFVLTSDQVEGDSTKVSITYQDLPREVTPGAKILLDDGLIELKVESVSGTCINTRVIAGGPISNRKGVNVPDISLDMPYISSKDRSDLRFFVENGFDYIAASFVRSADDVREIRDELNRLDSKNKIKIIAKIENSEGVRNADSIISHADGLMVARGDLGVEVAFEEVPVIQKSLIKMCISNGKPVITATQMLESMITNARPTRAEAADVANAIYDGTSAIMLSGETAAGKYPVEAITTMSRIAQRIEKEIDYRQRIRSSDYKDDGSITSAISHATVTTAHDLRASAILSVSNRGITPTAVSKFRPSCPIIACTPDPVTQRQLKLVWGVIPLLTATGPDTSTLFSNAIEVAKEKGHINDGDVVVLTAGIPVGQVGNTNMLKVHIIGEKISIS